MLVLEDGSSLRLLEGLISLDPEKQDRFALEHTPTRFGRVTLEVQALANSEGKGWKADATLDLSTRPASIEIPVSISGRKFDRIEGAKYQRTDGTIVVDPAAPKWSAFWL